jgi:hypothetical protein
LTLDNSKKFTKVAAYPSTSSALAPAKVQTQAPSASIVSAPVSNASTSAPAPEEKFQINDIDFADFEQKCKLTNNPSGPNML